MRLGAKGGSGPRRKIAGNRFIEECGCVLHAHPYTPHLHRISVCRGHKATRNASECWWFDRFVATGVPA